MKRNLLLGAVLLLTSFNSLFAVDCGTNCKKKCRPNRYLPPEPGCYLSCETTRKTACDVGDAVQNKANRFAMDAKDSGNAKDRTDCNVIVVALMAAAGAELGNAVGAALGGGAGVAAADMACRRAFPENKDSE